MLCVLERQITKNDHFPMYQSSTLLIGTFTCYLYMKEKWLKSVAFNMAPKWLVISHNQSLHHHDVISRLFGGKMHGWNLFLYRNLFRFWGTASKGSTPLTALRGLPLDLARGVAPWKLASRGTASVRLYTRVHI